jgi:hypothetical protein
LCEYTRKIPALSGCGLNGTPRGFESRIEKLLHVGTASFLI